MPTITKCPACGRSRITVDVIDGVAGCTCRRCDHHWIESDRGWDRKALGDPRVRVTIPTTSDPS